VNSESEPIGQNDPAPNTQRKSDAQQAQGNPDMSGALGISPPPPPKAHCEITCKTEKDFWDHVKTGAELLGIVLLAVYTGYTIKMYCANKQAADAAESAAGTASNALKFTQDSFRDEQRAWVGVPDLQIVSLPSPTTIDAFLHNSGRTPALHVHRASAYMLRDHIVDGPGPEDIAMIEKKILTSGEIAIAPEEKAALESSDGDNYVFNKWAKIQSGTEFVYIYGIIRYADVANRTHKTTFCYFLRHPTKPLQLGACEAFNNMD
jgi:hypothetical protein